MLARMKKVIGKAGCWTEIRFHRRETTRITIKNGLVKNADSNILAGAGIRCLVDGCWGFISTTDVSESGLEQAVIEASKAAELGAVLKKDKIEGLAAGETAQGEFIYVPAEDEPSFQEKIELFLEAESKLRQEDKIVAGTASYTQFNNEKYVANTDGAEVHLLDIKRDYGLMAIASDGESQEMGLTSAGITGNWSDLFAERTLDEGVKEAVEIALKKLKAKYAPGGEYTVILDPGLVGVLAHEAIGHTVEADFVMSGSIVQGKIGEKVASELITLIDDGTVAKATGMVLADDEGVLGKKTIVIEEGILKGYLHNRESAYHFETEPAGNARAYTYQDQPLIRMTNTFIEPGEDTFSEMVKGIEDGFYLKGLGQGGQADANAEFMFGVQEAYRIKDGEIREPVKGITISGQAFQVLKSVDAVSQGMKFALGRGYCGKGQPAKVDAGGPYLRCRVTIGGQQQ